MATLAVERPAFDDSGLAIRVSDTVFRRFAPDRNFTVNCWNQATLNPDSGQESDFTVKLSNPHALRTMLAPKLGHFGSLTELFAPAIDRTVGEAYISEVFDIHGNIQAFTRLGLKAISNLTFQDWLEIRGLLKKLPEGPKVNNSVAANLKGREHSRESDSASIIHFYDELPMFYRLMLDTDRPHNSYPGDQYAQYSCGLFLSPDMSLTEAQKTKLDHSIGKLNLRPGQRLVDIGCGWGGLVIRAAQMGFDATGITLSPSQAEYAKEWITALGLSDHCRVLVCDYRDLGRLTKKTKFDGATSVGMVEHVGLALLPEYFRDVRNAIKPGAIFLCHGINNGIETPTGPKFPFDLLKEPFKTDSFISRYVFPNGELVSAYVMQQIAESAGFEVLDVENLRPHYAMTLSHWNSRLEANWPEAVNIIGVTGEELCRVHRYYMASSESAFLANWLTVNQFKLTNNRPDGTNNAPLVRAA